MDAANKKPLFPRPGNPVSHLGPFKTHLAASLFVRPRNIDSTLSPLWFHVETRQLRFVPVHPVVPCRESSVRSRPVNVIDRLSR